MIKNLALICAPWTPSLAAEDNLKSQQTIPRSVRQAFKVAEGERPGATHLELPEDVASEEVANPRVHPRVAIRRPVPDDKVIRLAAERIRAAKHPMMIVSAGANRKRIGKQLHLFLERTGIYAVTTQMGKGVLSDDSPNSLFTLGIHKKDYVHSALDNADVVLTVGYDVVEYPPSVWNERRDKSIIHIDFNVAEPDECYQPEIEVLGDISHTLWAIYSQLDGVRFDDDQLAALRRRLDEALHPKTCDVCFPPKPQQIVHDVRQVMGRKDVICLDNGIYKLWFARMYKTYHENTVLLDNALTARRRGPFE